MADSQDQKETLRAEVEDGKELVAERPSEPDPQVDSAPGPGPEPNPGPENPEPPSATSSGDPEPPADSHPEDSMSPLSPTRDDRALPSGPHPENSESRPEPGPESPEPPSGSHPDDSALSPETSKEDPEPPSDTATPEDDIAHTSPIEALDPTATTPALAGDDLADETAPRPVPTTPLPLADDGQPAAASLRDVTRTAGSFARGRLSALQVFLQGHRPTTLATALILVVAVVVIVLIASRLADLPSTSFIEQDMRTRYAQASYDTGAYGSDAPLELASAQVLSCDRTDETGKCEARVALTFASESARLDEEVSLTYDRQDGAWTCVGSTSPENVVYEATAGIDTEKAIDNIGLILSKAESSVSENDGTLSLLTLYADADVRVTSEQFDPQSQDDRVSLHLTRTSAFTSYECDLSARFVFRPGNGMWELSSAAASRTAKQLTLTPLIGTWTGSFEGQTAVESKCFGGKATDMSLVITSAEKGRISGTLSCLAHYHGDLQSDAERSEGDTELTDVAFSGVIDETSSGIAFTCTTPEDAKGGLGLRIVFGTPDDPEKATATVVTTASYESSFLFIPYERQSRFADTYALTKAH